MDDRALEAPPSSSRAALGSRVGCLRAGGGVVTRHGELLTHAARSSSQGEWTRRGRTTFPPRRETHVTLGQFVKGSVGEHPMIERPL